MYVNVGISRGVFLLMFVAGATVVACSSEAEPTPTQEAPLIKDIASMVREPDGSFRVTCADGTVERRSPADIAAERVCNGSGAGGTCVEGNAAFCTDPKEHWTGTLCCVEGAPTCDE